MDISFLLSIVTLQKEYSMPRISLFFGKLFITQQVRHS